MAVTPQRMTLAEFLELPEVKPARELRQGVVERRVWRSGPCGAMLTWLGAQILTFAEPRELAQGFTIVRLILGQDSYVPDLSVYLWDRVPEDERGRLPMYFTTPPDLVAELLSPGQELEVWLDRCREYIGRGVRVAMLADPDDRGVYLIRSDGEVGPLREGDPIDITDVLPGIQLTVSDLFDRIRARPSSRHG